MEELEFTDEELALLNDMQLAENQLRNLNKVMQSSVTPKKLKRMEKEVLPGYIVRARNSRSKAEDMMAHKGYISKRKGA